MNIDITFHIPTSDTECIEHLGTLGALLDREGILEEKVQLEQEQIAKMVAWVMVLTADKIQACGVMGGRQDDITPLLDSMVPKLIEIAYR